MSATRMIMAALGGLALLAALVWALWPEPRAVDLGQVTRGPLEVTLLAEGMTRVREPYTVTAPIAGTTTRAPVQTGDRVVGGETVVAVIQPADPGLMDARSRAQAEAAVAEARAAVQLAAANLARATSALDHARAQRDRGRVLAESGTIAQRMLEDLEQAVTAAQQARDAVAAEGDLAQAALLRAQAQLLGPGVQLVPGAGVPSECCLRILAPHGGTVLEVTDRNARQVAAGMPLLTIGDLADLEIEIDLLSSDAVRVPPAAKARVERWGGPGVLDARLRRVEPAAFTRVSALGIEEQRVRLQLDLLAPPEDWPGLGDRFRVMVRLVLWQGAEVLQVPQAALFRHEGGWAVFRKLEGRAVLSPVTLGQRSEESAEILSGLEAGDQVVLFPASDLADGAAISARDL